jgi:hypothetical protein
MTRETLALWLAVATSYVGNPLSMWLAIHRRPVGWVIVAVTQMLFVAFAVVAVDWRFGGQVLCLGMGCYGVWKWWIRREHEPAIGRAAGGVVTAAQPMLIGPTPDPQLRVITHDASALDGLAGKVIDALERDGHQIRHRVDPTDHEVLLVAQDALAALNHHDRERAAELRERLEIARMETT